MHALLRLLDVVRRELGADDVRAEIGGKEPEGRGSVWASLPGGFRVVATFDTPPADPERLREKLGALAASFGGVVPAPDAWSTLSHELAARRLDDELEVLVDRAGAVRAVVIDVRSPVIWGSSGMLRGNEGVESALETARAADEAEAAGVDLAELLETEGPAARERLEQSGVEPRVAVGLARTAETIRRESRRSGAAWRHYLLTSRAIAATRDMTAELPSVGGLRELVRRDGWALLARGFGSIYCLVLVFDGAFSELHAEAAVVHALPVIERMVLSLPPVDPPPRAKEGKVVRLAKRR